jgi:hypothetical protein
LFSNVFGFRGSTSETGPRAFTPQGGHISLSTRFADGVASITVSRSVFGRDNASKRSAHQALSRDIERGVVIRLCNCGLPERAMDRPGSRPD